MVLFDRNGDKKFGASPFFRGLGRLCVAFYFGETMLESDPLHDSPKHVLK